MTRILLCWEDEYCEKLDVCLRRARRARASDGESEPSLMRVSARGHGGFAPYVRRGWPIARTKGIPKSGGAIDYLICIADADRASDCCRVGAPPASPTDTTPWIREADQRWTEQLRQEAGDSEKGVFGRFLRWNKESLLIAGYDSAAALGLLGCRERSGLGPFLSSCRPDPNTLRSDDDFVHAYHQSAACFQALVKATGGPRLSKST